MAVSRRNFVATAVATAASGVLLGACKSRAAASAAPAATAPATTRAAATTQANDRVSLAVIGCGGIARWHGGYLKKYVNIVAACDVDKGHAASYNKEHAEGKAAELSDYRKVLERKDVDAVLIATPDHWHAKICADAMRAGKDVYSEKPLTLTIDEGRKLCQIVRETSRVLQVGTQQRSEDRFQTAVALVHAGRLGKIRQAMVVVPSDTPKGAGFKPENPPAELDWEMWLGPTPKVPYIKERAHYNFRWWYEYSGGMMTDWGAHHVDIAQWAIAPDLPGPHTIEPVKFDLPVGFERGYPTVSNGFNTATGFKVKCTFANGADLVIADHADGFPANNGVLIQGDAGWLYVDRLKITGPAVERLKDEPLPEGAMAKLTKVAEMPHERHFVNFLDCVRSRALPLGDVFSHHRHLTTCHLANIAMRLGRTLKWDASAQQIVGDAEADAFQSRTARKGYEIA